MAMDRLDVPEDRLSFIVRKYKKRLSKQHQQELDEYVAAVKDKLVALLKGDVVDAEKYIVDQIKAFIEHRRIISHDYFLAGVEGLNPFLKLIQQIDKKASDMMHSVEAEVELNLNDDLLSPVKKLRKRAFKFLNNTLLVPIHGAFANVGDIQDLTEESMNMIRMSTAVIATGKAYEHARQMLNVEYWLKHQQELLAMLANEIMHKKQLNIKSSGKTQDELNKFYKKIFPQDVFYKKDRRIEVSSLPLSKFRAKMEAVLPYDEVFRRLTSDVQEKIIHELEIMHLNKQLQACEKDILVRLSVERSQGDKKDIPRNNQIKANLAYAAREKKKKLLARIFTLVGIGLGVAFIVAALAAAPPIALVAIAGGIVVSLVVAKYIHDEDSSTYVAEKGWRYFVKKIHLLFHPEKKMQDKYQDRDETYKVQTKVNKNISKKAFERYKEKLAKHPLDEYDLLAEAETKQVVGTEGQAQATSLIRDQFNHANLDHPVTRTSKVQAAKKYAGLRKFIGLLQTLEAAIYKDLPASQISQFATQVGDYAILAAKNPDATLGMTLTNKISVAKFKKHVLQVVKMATFVVYSGYKCVRAQSILKFDYWLKRQLVERFELQRTSNQLKRFLENNPVDSDGKLFVMRDDQHIQNFYDIFKGGQFVDKDNKKNNVFDLSPEKFRALLKEKLAGEDEFLKLSDNDQIHAIARLESHYLTEKLVRSEKDMLLRANIEMSKKDLESRAHLADHLEKNYLAYESHLTSGFGSRLVTAIKHPTEPTRKTNPDAKDDFDRNKEIVDHLKENLNAKRRKMVARTFLLLFAGLSLAALIASFALAPVPVIVGLTVAALACVLIAKLVKGDESIKDTVKKGFSHLSQKMNKQFSFWSSKEKMAEKKEAPEMSLPFRK